MANLVYPVADAAALTADETAIRTILETVHTVTPISDETAEASAASYDGAVISPAVVNTTLQQKYGPAWGKPVLILRTSVAIDHGIFDASSTTGTQTAIDIIFPEHVAADGAALGNLTIHSAASNMSGATAIANLGAGVVPIAEQPSAAVVVCCIAEEGATGVSVTFAKRRAFLGISPAGAEALIAAGESFLLNLVDWTLTAKPAQTVYTVGATGRHFASGSAAQARFIATNVDIVAQAMNFLWELYDDADFDEQFQIPGTDGFTGDETYRLTVEPAVGQRYTGTPGSGVRFRFTGTPAIGSDFVVFLVPFIRFGYVEIDGSAAAFSGDTGNSPSSACKTNSDGAEFHDIYIHDIRISNRNQGVSSLLGTGSRFWNIEIANVQAGPNPGSEDTSGLKIEVPASGSKEVYNVIVRDTEGVGCRFACATGGTHTARNIESVENTGDDFVRTGVGTYDHDYLTSEDATATGANSDTGVNPATEFVSATPNATGYFRLRGDAVGRGTGQDLGVGHFAAVDITGATRPAGAWDRAARQGAAMPLQPATVGPIAGVAIEMPGSAPAGGVAPITARWFRGTQKGFDPLTEGTVIAGQTDPLTLTDTGADPVGPNYYVREDTDSDSPGNVAYSNEVVFIPPQLGGGSSGAVSRSR